jgi:4-alpha-glucanotransferase
LTDPTAAPSEELLELAAAHGVATRYWDWQQRHVVVPAGTVIAVLAGLDVDAGTPAAVRASLARTRARIWRRMLPPTVVTRAGTPTRVPVHVIHGSQPRVWIELEDGAVRHDLHQLDVYVPPRLVGGVLIGRATFEIPGDLPLGWHRLRATVGEEAASSVLVVTPARIGLPAALRERRAWGFMTQLYSVRSRRSWGLGDLDDLAELASWSGHQLGAGFVLVNPLHAAAPVGPMEPSPYLPATRRFVNPIYARVEAVPEFAYLDGDARARVEALAAHARRGNTTADLLDRDTAWAAKVEALGLVHAVPRSPGRATAYAEYLRREGSGLVDFATWCALAEVHGLPWQRWPEPLRDPRSPEVDKARAELADRVDFYSWLQWVLDDQLDAAQRVALGAGMALGVIHDLAVGAHPQGADAWAQQDAFALGITVGVPADAYNQQGQDWSQPPWRPDRLAELGYAPWRETLRTILRHAGGIRVDHIIGLFRLWWVPAGLSPAEGTYVRYDHEALIGILALEAFRAGAVVVGEDLGTVEPWVRDYLAERGLLGTSILWFERDDSTGRPLRPEKWRELCLGSVTTHDLPPTAGYLAGEHIRIRSELGLLTRTVEEERAVDAKEQSAVLAALRSRGLLPPGAGERQIVEALHTYLRRTRCRLLGVALTDAVGDRRAMNQPGTSDEYPNWRMPLTDGRGAPVLLEDLVLSERARSLAHTVRL